MTDKRGDIIQAVKQCLRRNGCSSCENCPYTHVGDGFECREKLRDDIIALLKAQQPRVMTLEEVLTLEESAPVWLEDVDKKNVIGALFVKNFSDTQCVDFVISRNLDFKLVMADYCDYGFRWRCWTARPTDAQRKATPWKE